MLLARRAYARGELRARLVKAADEETVEGVLNQLERLNLLNDAEYAYNFAFCRIKQDAWGALRIRRSLTLRHVAPDLIEAALSRMQAEIGEQNSLEEYLERQYQKRGLPADRKGIQRLVLHLRRRGFNDEVIYSALRRMIQPAAWRRFETGD
jgi:regulatory protein